MIFTMRFGKVWNGRAALAASRRGRRADLVSGSAGGNRQGGEGADEQDSQADEEHQLETEQTREPGINASGRGFGRSVT